MDLQEFIYARLSKAGWAIEDQPTGEQIDTIVDAIRDFNTKKDTRMNKKQKLALLAGIAGGLISAASGVVIALEEKVLRNSNVVNVVKDVVSDVAS